MKTLGPKCWSAYHVPPICLPRGIHVEVDAMSVFSNHSLSPASRVLQTTLKLKLLSTRNSVLVPMVLISSTESLSRLTDSIPRHHGLRVIVLQVKQPKTNPLTLTWTLKVGDMKPSLNPLIFILANKRKD
ncbi:hypothetical protein L484_016004 [Morus notabilis]|uniref:Uncharacterized protein n=1 Tax=Morus notabilis TaxID=981085 RepID=W9R9U7_9ROSA|nr:hypothetical protein L484_016004 [Morus notabilis]